MYSLQLDQFMSFFNTAKKTTHTLKYSFRVFPFDNHDEITDITVPTHDALLHYLQKLASYHDGAVLLVLCYRS